MRLLLAALGLLIVLIDPVELDRFATITTVVLGLYTAYSASLYGLALRYAQALTAIDRWAHWIDIGWYTVLIALSSATSSFFFFGFTFAILVASFRWGFGPGLRATLTAILLFSAIGLSTASFGPGFELNRFLLRAISLLVLGYLIAYWGGYEITLKRQLALLREVTTLSNPRLGVDRTIGALMERLRVFYNADACLLVTIDLATGEPRLRRADPHDPEAAVQAAPIPTALAEQLLSLPAEHAVIYGRACGWLHRKPHYTAYEPASGRRAAEGQAEATALAATLEAESFVSVPLRSRGEASGQLFLTTGRRCAFGESDTDFLLQVIDHVAPVLDNIRLVDRLASDAAEAERQRIARDLHDSVIQPYIGLQMGLAAVRQKVADGIDVSADLERLIALTHDGIADLRGYVRGLRGAAERGDNLLPAVRRFAAKFAEATGITVNVEAPTSISVSDRLAAEVFQMIAEGLSNVRRHTQSAQATVRLARQNGMLMLRVENLRAGEQPDAPFAPRSIAGRASALGGRAYVEQTDGASTAVVVEIPL